MGLAIALLCTSAACRDDRTTNEPEVGAQRPARGEAPPVLDVALADGARFRLADHAGKVIVVDLWATWCEPCADAMLELDALAAELGAQGLVVVGISLDDDGRDIPDFVRRLGVRFPIAHDHDGAVRRAWAPAKMPTTWVIGRDGRVDYVNSGYRRGDETQISSAIRGALAKPAATSAAGNGDDDGQAD